jgi:hypothetical protein
MVEAVDSFAPDRSPFKLPVYPTASPHVVFSLWIKPRITRIKRILDWGAQAPRVLVSAPRRNVLFR